MTGWTHRAPALGPLTPEARTRLDALQSVALPRGTVLFRAGDPAGAFALILSGRVEVTLPGPEGRGLLLYAVAPGQSCMQTTLSLLGGEAYTGEATAATACEAVAIPRVLFLSLMEDEPAFRSFVFSAFGQRMREMLRLMSTLAFRRLEARLAALLLQRAQGGVVLATQADLAEALGTAREVVSRKLDTFARLGWVETGRGRVRLTDPEALARMTEDGEV